MRKIFGETRPAGQLLALVLIFIVMFIITMGVTVAATLMGAKADSLLLQALTQIVCFAGTAVVFALLIHGNVVDNLGLRFNDVSSQDVKSPTMISSQDVKSPTGVGRKLVGAALVLVCVVPLSDWLAQVNDSWHLPTGLAWLEEMLRELSATSQALLEGFLLRDSWGALAANLVVLALVPAVCEELLFRGALQQVLLRCCRNAHVAIWFTAAIFSLMHGEAFAFLPRLMLGALLGYFFYYGGSLWFNALAHFLNNAIVVVLYFLVARGHIAYEIADSFNSPWYLALLGAIVAIALFWLFFRRGCPGDSQ